MEINQFSLSQIGQYCDCRFGGKDQSRRRHRTENTTDASMVGSAKQTKAQDRKRKEQYNQVLLNLVKLKRAIENEDDRKKNVDLLMLSADLVRWLGGMRVCSCKSAKDRTSMSLTLEEARLLVNLHKVDETDERLANVMREHGVRLINVHKNTGVPKFAFNSLQRKMLPQKYRPPLSTVGSIFRRGNVT